MPTNDFTTELLEMEDSIIENIETFFDHIVIHLHKQRQPHICPQCGAITEMIHDYRVQTVKDLPIHGKPVVWKLKKRRYRCHCCGKRFFEKNSLLPKFHRITNRLALYSIQLLKEQRSLKSIAISLGVSSSSVFRWLKLAAVKAPTGLPMVLSIDEFRGNAGGEKFQCILTDPRRRRVLDILPNRKDWQISSYLRAFHNKNDVQFVVMDMNKAYLSTMKSLFPQAKIVIDRFHVMRYCTWAMDNVRKDIQKNLPSDQRKYFKRSRRLLLAHMDKLNDEAKEALNVMLAFSDKLVKAYLLKEIFYQFMASDSREKAAKNLTTFLLQANIANLDEFKPVVTMLNNWRPYILNSFDCSYSNGFTEGCNNKIKVLKRLAYGYQDFDNFRKRILFAFQ